MPKKRKSLLRRLARANLIALAVLCLLMVGALLTLGLFGSVLAFIF